MKARIFAITFRRCRHITNLLSCDVSIFRTNAEPLRIF